MLHSCPHHIHTNEVLAHAFFKGLEYNARALLNSAISEQALSITSETFFDLLDKLLEENQMCDGDSSRTITQKFAGILDVDQAIALNAKIDVMQHSMVVQFMQLTLNQASINVVQQAANWRGLCGSGTHDIEQC